MQVTLEASMSPLVLCDRLLTLAQDADRAGLRRAAESLLELVGAVLEPAPKESAQAQLPVLADHRRSKVAMRMAGNEAETSVLIDVPRGDQDVVRPQRHRAGYPVLRAKAMHSATKRRPIPAPRADGSTISRRSFASAADFRTRNTDPTFTPSHSAIQQRSDVRSWLARKSPARHAPPAPRSDGRIHIPQRRLRHGGDHPAECRRVGAGAAARA